MFYTNLPRENLVEDIEMYEISGETKDERNT